MTAMFVDMLASSWPGVSRSRWVRTERGQPSRPPASSSSGRYMAPSLATAPYSFNASILVYLKELLLMRMEDRIDTTA